MAGSLVRVPPLYYLHILDNNTNVVRLETGPQNITIEAHEIVVLYPTQMITIPPLHYCKFENPVEIGADKKPVKQKFEDADGVREIYKVKFGAKEIRTNETHPDPFPLYPYEKVIGKVDQILQIPVHQAIKLKAIADFVDNEGNEIKISDEWVIKGPCSYLPHTKVEIVENIKAEIILPGTALKILAIRDCVDVNGIQRKTGEKYLIRKQGAYIRLVEEKVLKMRTSKIITQKQCLHLCAKQNFKDIYGIQRKAGDEWLVTIDMSEQHIQDVHEKIIEQPDAIILTNRQYCYIIDPCDQKTGKNLFGQKQLRKGECTFFLQPKEQIENDDIFEIFILADDEALLLQAEKEYTQDETVYKAGDRWMIYGPCEYIPPVEVKVLETRRKLQLAEKEGIYIRDTKTGEVRSQIGESYMLKPYEELWEKPLAYEVEWLLGFRIKEKLLLANITNIAGGDQNQVEDLKNQIAMLNIDVPKEDPSFKQAQDFSSNFRPSKKIERAQERATKGTQRSKAVEQRKRKAPMRKKAAPLKEKAKKQMEMFMESSEDEEELAVDFRQEENLMAKLQVFNEAQQAMQSANQQADFQMLQMGDDQQTIVSEEAETKFTKDDSDDDFPIPAQPVVQPQQQLLKKAAPSTRGRGRGGSKKAGARYLEDNLMQQIQDELPFGTMEQAPVQKIEKEYFDFQQKTSGFGLQEQVFQQPPQVLYEKQTSSVSRTKAPTEAKKPARKESKPKVDRAFPAPEEKQPIKFKQGARPWDETISLRDRKKLVCFRAPHNSAVQIYNFKTKETKIEFGPELVALEPDELFTICRLSGGRPKRENAIALLYLPLGPDFMADVVEIETADHARLQLSLTYHWKFDIQNKEDAYKVFSVRDFIGYGCRAIASRIRGLCSKYKFDEFHKNSAELIRLAAFGSGQDLRFEQNNLVIFGIDIQYVEPVDKKTRQGLSQSVSMAIEISTQMTKAVAEHIAAKQDQQWIGRLARQKIQDQIKAEESKRRLLELQADCKAIESTGHSNAIARAQAKTMEIDGKASVEKATLSAQSTKIIQETDIELNRLVKEQEIEHKKKLYNLEILKAKRLSDIEINKFQKQIQAVGAQTLISMAKAGPENQAKLLQGMGLKGFMMMDGKRPINLFNTAMGMVNQAQMS